MGEAVLAAARHRASYTGMNQLRRAALGPSRVSLRNWRNDTLALIVLKFGGTSVANTERLFNAASIAEKAWRDGEDVVVVVSAQGDTTDELLQKAAEICPAPPAREMDMLLATGEQISISLLCMALYQLGCPAVSLTGWQAGMTTDSQHTSSRIRYVEPGRVKKELAQHKIVVVAGFQGVDEYSDITTIGRGGSDTTAVALAAALGAARCIIYTDVDGVYTADPRMVTGARKLDEITYDEMLELASMGAQVLHNRSVEMAKRHRVDLEVRSSFTNEPGTLVREETMESRNVSGVARDLDVAVISLTGTADVPGIAYKIFDRLAEEKINVDMIVQSAAENGQKHICFTVDQEHAARALELIKRQGDVEYRDLAMDPDVSKISIVGAGMAGSTGVASDMFEALYEQGINIMFISTSEIKVSVIIKSEDTERAMQAIHDKFFG